MIEGSEAADDSTRRAMPEPQEVLVRAATAAMRECGRGLRRRGWPVELLVEQGATGYTVSLRYELPQLPIPVESGLWYSREEVYTIFRLEPSDRALADHLTDQRLSQLAEAAESREHFLHWLRSERDRRDRLRQAGFMELSGGSWSKRYGEVMGVFSTEQALKVLEEMTADREPEEG